MPQHLYLILRDESDVSIAENLATHIHRPFVNLFQELASRPISEYASHIQNLGEARDWCVIVLSSTQESSNPRIAGILRNTGMALHPGQDASYDIKELLIQTQNWRDNAPYRTILFKNLLKQCSKASAQWNLFEANDRILVGVSGGQDSLVLMHILTSIKKRLPYPITIIPATIDLGYPGFNCNAVIDYCASQGWSLEIERIPEIQEFFKENHVGDKPCPLCSRLRRGKLHGLLDKFSCNKLALGQHLDDLCVSFLMSLFRGGGLKTMCPNTFADGGKARLIRPLWDCTKKQIKEVAQLFEFPTIQSCPFETELQENGDRFYLEQLLIQLEERFPDIRSAMKHSMGDIRLEHLLGK